MFLDIQRRLSAAIQKKNDIKGKILLAYLLIASNILKALSQTCTWSSTSIS